VKENNKSDNKKPDEATATSPQMNATMRNIIEARENSVQAMITLFSELLGASEQCIRNTFIQERGEQFQFEDLVCLALETTLQHHKENLSNKQDIQELKKRDHSSPQRSHCSWLGS
jgi:hypothetical protein